jgi:hypothetical protein
VEHKACPAKPLDNLGEFFTGPLEQNERKDRFGGVSKLKNAP